MSQARDHLPITILVAAYSMFMLDWNDVQIISLRFTIFKDVDTELSTYSSQKLKYSSTDKFECHKSFRTIFYRFQRVFKKNVKSGNVFKYLTRDRIPDESFSDSSVKGR